MKIDKETVSEILVAAIYVE